LKHGKYMRNKIEGGQMGRADGRLEGNGGIEEKKGRGEPDEAK
jgi:hypothetical protein